MSKNFLLALLLFVVTAAQASDPVYSPHLNCSRAWRRPPSPTWGFDVDVVATKEGAYAVTVVYSYGSGSQEARVSLLYPSTRYDDPRKGLVLYSSDFDPSGNSYGADLLVLENERAPDGGMKARLTYNLPPENGLPNGLFGELDLSCR